MTFVDWLTDTRRRIGKGREGVLESAYELYVGALRRYGTVVERGHNVYENDWDTLVLLDACRVDALEHVSREYSWMDNVGQRRSIAGRSDDWMERTFHESYSSEMSRTVYVTGNPFASSCIDDSDFLEVEHVYQAEWDREMDAMPARPVTDAAIRAGRRYEDEDVRLIVHYMQPHFPSIPSLQDDQPNDSFGSGGVWDRWNAIRQGDIHIFDVIQSYVDNLQYVLDDVELLRENLNAEQMIISSDHGTALGEFGVYGHSGFPMQCVRNVPWVVTEAFDENTYSAEETFEKTEEPDVTDQLSALGYK
ncbi:MULTISPECIES: hypothetical protein [Salinibaculum]|uniref:hypothetical protein n=1 Tax=Salinibaculum TaxID=2732368 RepID=UPI0030D0CA1C